MPRPLSVARRPAPSHARRRRVPLGFACLLLIAGLLAPTAAASASSPSLNLAFQRAAEEFGVPRDLLVAIAWAETHFDDHGGQPSVDNGYGLMHLVDNPVVQTLPTAARLLHDEPVALQRDPNENIRGAAALLRAYADAASLDAVGRGDLGRWYGVVARYSNAGNPSVAQGYADEVYRLLNEGIGGLSPDGESIAVLPSPVTPEVAAFQATTPTAGGSTGSSTSTGPSSTSTSATAPTVAPGPDLDYPPALWVPASPDNYDTAGRPSTQQPINLIVIHVTEGSYTAAINWFQNPAAESSAHYVVRSSDGQVTQLVHLKDIAWHAGNYAYNSRSIGIEHEGYVASATWFTDAMYRSSANLVRALCLKYGIPMDRQHIIGHDEVPDPNNPKLTGGAEHHTDPGPNWNWDYYLKLINTTPAAPAGQMANTTYFSATSHNLGPAFGSYWNANGGLPVFGYPRTDSFQEQNPDTGQVYTVQYFERQRFELHPENANTPYAVLLGRLGLSDARSRGLLAGAAFQPRPPANNPNCSYAAPTGHFMCNAFLAYWQSHGLELGDAGISYRESLALFGYPISEEFVDPQTGFTVQYFERARFEYHPEYAGTQYDVLLGLLGNQVLKQRGWIQF